MAKFQGAGEVTITRLNLTTKRAAGPARFLGCVDSFDPSFAIQKGNEHFERCSGLGLLDEQSIKSISGALSLALTQWDLRTIAWMTAGTIAAEGSPAVAVQADLPSSDFEAGDYWHLGAETGQTKHNITGFVLKDSASPENTLTLNTHYTLDAVYGTIKFLDVSGFTQPFVTNAYGYTQPTAVAVANDTGAQYLVRFNSKNVRDGLSKGVEELYVWQPDPITSLPGIGDDFATFTISGPLFADLTREIDDDYGRFGKIIPVATVA